MPLTAFCFLIDYVVVQFADNRATKLDMKAVFCHKKFDGNRSIYDEYLKAGDNIVVQHPRTMDRKQQSSVATIILVTSKKADAEAAEKKLEDQAKAALVRLSFSAYIQLI